MGVRNAPASDYRPALLTERGQSFAEPMMRAQRLTSIVHVGMACFSGETLAFDHHPLTLVLSKQGCKPPSIQVPLFGSDAARKSR